MPSELERYISDNALQVSFTVILQLLSLIFSFKVLWSLGQEHCRLRNRVRFVCHCYRTVTTSPSPIASSSKTTDALFSSLHAAGLPDTPPAHVFISEVYRQAPQKHKHRNPDDAARKRSEKDAKA